MPQTHQASQRRRKANGGTGKESPEMGRVLRQRLHVLANAFATDEARQSSSFVVLFYLFWLKPNVCLATQYVFIAFG